MLQDWISGSGSSGTCLHCPIVQVDGRVSFMVVVPALRLGAATDMAAFCMAMMDVENGTRRPRPVHFWLVVDSPPGGARRTSQSRRWHPVVSTGGARRMHFRDSWETKSRNDGEKTEDIPPGGVWRGLLGKLRLTKLMVEGFKL